MNWKRISLFILLWLIGVIIFYVASMFTYHISYFFPLFIVLYTIFLFLVVKEYSHKKLTIVVSIFLLYLLINIIPFPTCDIWAQLITPGQECKCIGIKKTTFGIIDAGGTQCVGIPMDYKCGRFNSQTRTVDYSNGPCK